VWLRVRRFDMGPGRRLLSKVGLVIPLLSILLVAVACGTAAPPTEPVGEPEAASVPEATPIPTAVPEAVTAPSEVEVNPGKLTIMVGDFASERFDSTFMSGAPGQHNYMRILHGLLISDNEKREMVPGIASQWGVSADGLTWTFTIREGVKFHDGSELTVEDVLWTFQHTFGPQAFEYVAHSSGQKVSRAIDSIALSGPDKVSLTTKEPDIAVATILSETGIINYPIMPKRAKLGDADEAVAYDQKPIGAGFMRLLKHVPASVMQFERFDDFYYQPKNGFPEDKRVNFQSLDLFLAPEEATRVAAIRAGDADIVPISLAVKEQVEAGGGRVVFGPESVIVEPYLVGCYDPQYPCHDKRVHQALNYAIDKELMRDRLYGGPEAFELKGWAAVTPSTIGYTPGLDPWPFDPDKARQLLAEAGYPGGKGFGKLIINTRAATSLPFLVEGAQLGAEFWKRELVLDVEVRVGDSTALREKRLAGELNGQVYWEENDTRVDFSTSLSSSFGDPKSPSRKHQDPELFRVTQEALGILDLDERAEAYKELFPRLREEAHYIGIGYTHLPWAVGPRVLKWQPYPLALYPSALHTITLE
jgi:peptide/nickel transport system substrate-binding protein